MECKVCFESYNDLDRKPWIIVNCGHTVNILFAFYFTYIQTLNL